MPHMTSRPRRSFAALAALLAALASLALAACGSSTSTSTTTAKAAGATTSASTTPTTGASGGGSSSSSSSKSTTKTAAPGAGPSRFAALRACLQKEGITLPTRKPGQAPGAGGFLGGGSRGLKLPAGVSRTKYEAAIKKCGGLPNFPRGGFRGPRIKFNSPAIKAALAKFAACLRTNGVNVPEANTSGKGPIFNTKGLNTGSATFKAAETKCRSDLLGAFRPRSGASG